MQSSAEGTLCGCRPAQLTAGLPGTGRSHREGHQMAGECLPWGRLVSDQEHAFHTMFSSPRAVSLRKAPTDQPRHPKPQRPTERTWAFANIHARRLRPRSLPEPPGSPTVRCTHPGPGRVRAVRTERNVGPDQTAGPTPLISLWLLN